MGKRKENSVLVSLRELQNIEKDRVEEEKKRDEERARSEQQARADEDRRRQEEEARQQREEEERAKADEERQRQEEREAGIRVQEAERKARVSAEMKLQQERMRIESQIKIQEKKMPWGPIAGLAGVAVLVIGGLVYNNYQQNLVNEARAREQAAALEKEQKRQRAFEAEIAASDERIKQIQKQLATAQTGAEIAALNRRLAKEQQARDDLRAERKKPRSGPQPAVRPTPTKELDCDPNDPLCGIN